VYSEEDKAIEEGRTKARRTKARRTKDEGKENTSFLDVCVQFYIFITIDI
jgi:hypothetical protein